jgi:hypothetical protein
MLEKNRVDIYIKQAIVNLFIFKKKPKIAEDWNTKTFDEQINSCRDEIAYGEHKWLKYKFLSDIIKWILYLLPILLLFIFGISVNFLIYTPIIIFIIFVGMRLLQRIAKLTMMKVRADWFILNCMINDKFKP